MALGAQSGGWGCNHYMCFTRACSGACMGLYSAREQPFSKIDANATCAPASKGAKHSLKTGISSMA